MAFQKTKTEGYQTSTNVAAEVVAALLAQGAVEADVQSVVGAIREIRDELFADISVVIDSDNEMLKAEAASSPAPSTNRRSTSADEPKSGGKTFSKDEGLALVVNFGKFKGLSIGDILALPKSEAENYGYTTGPGKTWVEWLSKDSEPARDYAKRAAVAALA